MLVGGHSIANNLLQVYNKKQTTRNQRPETRNMLSIRFVVLFLLVAGVCCAEAAKKEVKEETKKEAKEEVKVEAKEEVKKQVKVEVKAEDAKTITRNKFFFVLKLLLILVLLVASAILLC